jgi:hypothetical protein
MAGRQLTLEDIADLRAYERERDAFRQRVMALKRRRRVALGPLASVVFENRETVRFQVQEMARAERMMSDEQILGELAAYNPLIPDPGELSATLFLELTDEASLRTWLPTLVGIERSLVLRLADGEAVRCVPEAGHAEQLTREDITASVHYVRWQLTEAQVARFGEGGVVLASEHPAYQHETPLGAATVEELLGDLRP